MDREPAPCALVFEGVDKGFADRRGARVPVLDKIDLEIAPGSCVSILGPSGSGKSTLLRLAAGLESLDAQDAGLVSVGGRPPGDPAVRSALVFQAYSTFPWLTAEQNLALALKQAGVAKAERREAVRRLLANVRLLEHARQFPDQLSGGQRQRLAFACAIARQPDLLLLDEPMGALDTLTREHLQLELLKLRRLSRPTTVLVTHDLAEAVLLGERVILLSNRPARILLDLDTAAGKPWLTNPEMGAETLDREVEAYRRGSTMLSLTNALRDALTQDGRGNDR